MEEEEKIIRGTLSVKDQDVLSGMMVVYLRCAEKCISMLENHYSVEYMAGEQYNILKKKYGKLQADLIVKREVKKLIRGDERNKLGKILKIGEDFHKALEGLLHNAMTTHEENISDIRMFDGIQNDSNWLCYFYALIANCENDSDGEKILEYVKYLSTGNRASENLIKKLEVNN